GVVHEAGDRPAPFDDLLHDRGVPLDVAEVEGEELRACAARLDGGERLVGTAGVDVGQRDVKAARSEVEREGGADAAARAGHHGQGSERAHRNTSVRRCRPTRKACAAIVSAGFTAADDGKKLASTTYRLSWSHALHIGSSAEVAGCAPKRTVPHWCDGASIVNGLVSTIG